LVADAPQGPWKQVGDLMLRPENDGKSFDSTAVVNPRHVFFQGKWFMYYKGWKDPQPWTNNGVAIADSLTGPYRKHEKNPLLHGHGQFAWRYKHGIVMLKFDGPAERNETRVLWTEDGIHFVPLVEGQGTFRYGSIYCPYDPTFGKPVTDKLTQTYWGLHTVYRPGAGFLDIEQMKWQFGP
jgi:hypothetical protein